MMSRIKFSVFILLVVIISGCGGGSGDGEASPPVEPPPVEPPPPVDGNRFDHRFNNLEPRDWWRESEPYSCEPEENPNSPWPQAGLIDLGGSDPLSLIRWFGNGSYIRSRLMGSHHGCTQFDKHPLGYHHDAPVDPTYYSLGDLDIYVDIAHIPRSASGWRGDDRRRVSFSMNRAVELLNQHVAAYFRRVSEDRLQITFHAGNEFTVGGDGSPSTTHKQQLAELGICVIGENCSDFLPDFPGGLNRILLNDVAINPAGHGLDGWAFFALRTFLNQDMLHIVHEMGHAWMLWPHSFAEVSSERTPPRQYSNFYDMMSSLDPSNIMPILGWDANMPSTLAINRYSAGWIRPEDVALHREEEGKYTLSKPFESGNQFLVIHSGRRYAFTTLEVLEERSSKYKITKAVVYDPSAPGGKRPRRYEGVLVSRYDQSSGTGTAVRFGPAFYNRNNPNFLSDVQSGRDDSSVIQDGEMRDIGGGVSVSVKRNSDGSYEVTVSGGKTAPFPKWCQPIWFRYQLSEDEDIYDTGCLLNEPLENQ